MVAAVGASSGRGTGSRGRLRNTTVISVVRIGQLLAVPQVERHARPTASCRSTSERATNVSIGSPDRRLPPAGSRRTGRARRRRGRSGRIARSSFTFSSRKASGSSDRGGSMARNASTCSMWFCDQVADGARAARSTPARPSTPIDSATVSCTWSTASRFQTRSQIALANRNTTRFWTVSLPR